MSEQTKTLTIVDKSTKAMNTAATNLGKTIADLATIAETASGLAQDIEFKQSALDGLSGKYKEQERLEKAELKVRIVENEDRVLTDLMKPRNLATITNAELGKLRADLTTAQSDNAVAVNDAVTASVYKVNAEHDAEVVGLKAAQSVETAELKSDIKSLESRLENANETITSLRDMIDAERLARVETAKASQPIIHQPAAN